MSWMAVVRGADVRTRIQKLYTTVEYKNLQNTAQYNIRYTRIKIVFGVLPKTGDAEPEDPGKPG